MVCSALLYRGSVGEAYSPANHFVSELGILGTNPGAWLFNGGLVIGGACFIVFMAGLTAVDRHWLMKAASRVGMLAGVCAVLVGLIPANILMPHLVAAGGFFNAGLLAIVLFSAATFRSAVLPRWLVWVGLPALVSFIVLLASLTSLGLDFENLPLDERRPSFWFPPFVEWLVALSTLGWIGVVSWQMLRSARSGIRTGRGI